MRWYTAGQETARQSLGLKTADAIFPKLKTDPLSEIHRRLSHVFKLKTPTNDLTKDLSRLFKNPLKSVRLRRL